MKLVACHVHNNWDDQNKVEVTQVLLVLAETHIAQWVTSYDI